MKNAKLNGVLQVWKIEKKMRSVNEIKRLKKTQDLTFLADNMRRRGQKAIRTIGMI